MLLYKCCSWVGGDLSNSGNEMSECFRAIIAGGRRRGTHLDQDTEKAIWTIQNNNYYSICYISRHLQ